MADNQEIDLSDEGEGEQEQQQEETKTAAQKAKEERLRRLQELKLRKNEAINLNRREVVEEDKRAQLPANWENKKRRVEWELEEEKARQEAEARGEDFDRLKWLQLTAADADRIIEKKKRKAENVEKGFADFRQATARQYEKLAAQIKPDMNEYAREMVTKGADVFYDPSATLTYGDQERTKGDNIDRLVDDIKRRDEKRKNFSRRRPVHAEADIDYINDANAKFNQKIQRFFGESTSEIKQSLERGTAL